MFFTLSGFLITTLLLEERARTGRVDLRAFYVRRVRRLAPAFVVVVVAVAVGSLFAGPWWFQWADLTPVVLYWGNWVQASGESLGALAMTWSLAVEEQFYLVWPILLVFAAGRRRVMWVALWLGAASLVARFVLIADDASWLRVYYGSDTVAVYLLVGAALAAARVGSDGTRRSTTVGAAVGVALAVWTGAWPFAVVMVLGAPMVAAATALLLWSVTGSTVVRWLSVAPLRWFGSRSYGIYLWHAPMLWAMRTAWGWSWPVVLAVGVPASLLLAELSFRFVEAPFRARRNAPHPAVVAEQGAEVVKAS